MERTSPTAESVPTSAVQTRATWVVVVVVLALVAAAGVGTTWILRAEPDRQVELNARAVAVDAIPLARARLVVTARYTGQVVTESADLAARVAGHVEQVEVRIGDRVRTGDPLLNIDDDLVQRELRGARAEIEAAAAAAVRARARSEAADRELARAQPLVEQRTLAQQELDALRTDADSAKAEAAAARAQSEAARARLGLLEEQMAGTRIRAPFDGVIAARHVDPGAYVRAGDPLLRLVQEAPLRVHFRIPERDVGAIEVGDPVTVTVQSGARGNAAGRVTRLAGEISASDRTMLVEGELEDDPSIKPGMFADVSVVVDVLEDALVVPAESVVERIDASGRKSVGLFVADGERARFVAVVVHGRDEGRAAISGDLEVGQPILVRGHHDLADGAAVSVHVVKPQTAGGP